MKISSFKSLNGTTWVLSEGFCVLAYCRSRREAMAEKRRRLAEQQARERPDGDAETAPRL
jgi:hypothetical protein